MRLLALLLIAAALYFCASYVERAMDVPSWVVKFAAVLVGVGAFLLTARSFRCPRCRANLLLHAQFREPIGNFFETALAYRVCPKCGFRAGSCKAAG
jgi:hypothetical protein